MFPSDAITVKTIQAVAKDTQMIPTTTTEITVLNVHLDKFQQASQLVQCNVNGGPPFTTLAQAVGSTTVQDVDVQWVLPKNTICNLRTFDGTLTQAYITYVPRNITSTTMSTSTIIEQTANTTIIVSLLLVIAVGMGVVMFKMVKELT